MLKECLSVELGVREERIEMNRPCRTWFQDAMVPEEICDWSRQVLPLDKIGFRSAALIELKGDGGGVACRASVSCAANFQFVKGGEIC